MRIKIAPFSSTPSKAMYTTRLHLATVQTSQNSRTDLHLKRIESKFRLWSNALLGLDGAERKSLRLRLIWVSALILGLIASLVHVSFLVFQHTSRPAITDRREIEAEMTGVKFPSLIVCPLNWVNARKLKSAYKLDSDDPTFVYMKSLISKRYMSKIAQSNPQGTQWVYPLENSTQFNDTYQSIKTRVRDQLSADQEYSDQTFFKEIAFTCVEILKDCVWNGVAGVECCKESRPVFTPYGRCYLIKPPRIDELAMYTPSALGGHQIIPGPEGGFSMTIMTDRRSSIAQISANSSPKHLSNNGTVLYLIDPDQSSPTAVPISNPLLSPSNVHAHVRLRSIEKRREFKICPYPKLRYFSDYTREACEIECRVNASVQIFDCAILGDSSGVAPDSKICKSHDFHDRYVKALINALGPNLNRTTEDKKLLLVNENLKKLDLQYAQAYVNCTRQSCNGEICANTMEYHGDISYYSLNLKEKIGFPMPAENSSIETIPDYEEYSRLTIFYPRLSYEVWQESTHNSMPELLASIGGAFALWASISAATLIQLISHCIWVTVSIRKGTKVDTRTPPTPNGRVSLSTSNSQRTHDEIRSRKVHRLDSTM